MCGIAGIVALDVNTILPQATEHTVQAMTEAMHYRGPNGSGLWRQGSVCFGHRRLSIIDLAGGKQPMLDHTGRFATTFNGEIYNFRELRKELIERGANFQTLSDTEVLLEAYKAWGVDCLKRFEGMFAFALWDDHKKQLFCARDRFGKKPFFYSVQHNCLFFVSELTCLKEVEGLALDLDEQALMRYLAYQYVPCPQTMFCQVQQLPPASGMLVKDGKISLFEYWHMPAAKHERIDEEEACSELVRLMRQATARRMISDVPLGVFLSGGIDSSIVTGLMADISDKAVESFSIGFHESSYDESRYASLIAKTFHTNHHAHVLQSDECADLLPNIVSSMDMPVADASIAPTWLLSKITREHVTVALGGDGSDELWGGYEHYLGFAIALKYKQLPYFVRKRVIEPLCRLLPASANYVNLRLATDTFHKATSVPDWLCIPYMLTAFSPEMQHALLQKKDTNFLELESLYAPSLHAYRHFPFEATPLERSFHVYVRGFLLDDILVKIDRCSMLNSLEVRAPFLDRDVVEFVAALPVDMKLRGLKRKYLLKKAFASLLPEKILHRNKRGFQIPVASWLRGRMRPLMEELLCAESLAKHNFFNAQEVRRLMDAHISGKQDLRVPLWTLMVFQLWWQKNMT